MRPFLIAMLLLALTGCGGKEDAASAHRSGPPSRGGHGETTAAVPVEVAEVARRNISSFIETNCTLEAENEVDIVSRTASPIVALLVEEGDRITRGQVLARLDAQEYRAQLEIARVTLQEATLGYERAQSLQQQSLISSEVFDAAQSKHETAAAQHKISKILLGYTEIVAPFDGLVITRYVNFAEQVSTNTPLFRISDFDPMLCPIQVPERDLNLLHKQQPAYLEFEAFKDDRFEAAVLRINPVVDAATGTIKVTLAVQARGKLRPGMFARVFVETATHTDTLVIPKVALALDSIGDTVYVFADAAASRRDVVLGFQQGDFVEVLEGLTEQELVIVVGQDGLSDGTPIQILQHDVPQAKSAPAEQPEQGRGKRPDVSNMTPEQLERIKQRMRSKGMTEKQIEERLAARPQ
jgi:membrane fusion protein (multidrug efflux system)